MIILVLVLCSYLSCLLSVWRWKTAMFGIVLWEAARDPIRKLIPDYHLELVFAGLLLWLACLLGCVFDRSHPPRKIPKSFIMAGLCILIFESFGLVSAIRNSVPLPVMGLGILSYSFPFVGLYLGYNFGYQNQEVRELVVWFCLLNSLLVGTALLEILGFKSAALGGIMMEWYRFRGTYSIPLPSGAYRSPDILGLHAAHIFAFAFILALTSGHRWGRWGCYAVACWGAMVVLISARRKMQGLDLVFLLCFGMIQIFDMKRSHSIPANTIRKTVIVLFWLTVVGILLALYLPAHSVYALSVITELPDRAYASLLSAPWVTVQQSGIGGLGLGSATQGNMILSNGFASGWQEDGLSRLVLEGGVVGACVASAGVSWLFFTTVLHVLKNPSISDRNQFLLQSGLTALFAGNFACFCISHQHLSGDPLFGALTAFWVGCIWSTCRNAQDAREMDLK